MKVLALAPELLPFGGGASIYMSEIARRLPERHELHIAVPAAPSATMTELMRMLPRNVFIHSLRGSRASLLRDPAFKASVAVNLATLARETGCEVISSSSRMPDIFYKPRRGLVPIVTTVHSTVESHVNTLISHDRSGITLNRHERNLFAARAIAVACENRYYKSNRHFISVSKWSMGNLVSSKGVDPRRISLVYNGVDTERFNPHLRRTAVNKFPVLDQVDKMKVLFVGRFTFGKGLNVLLRTIRDSERTGKVHFVLAGDTSGILLEGISKEHATFLGHVPHQDIPYLYASCDVLILPSLYENMPLSLLEAMASGCVPIVSNVGGVSEVVQDGVNGILIDSRYPETITSALDELADDRELLRPMSLAGRSLVEGRHSLEDMIAGNFSVFETVVRDGPVLRTGISRVKAEVEHGDA